MISDDKSPAEPNQASTQAQPAFRLSLKIVLLSLYLFLWILTYVSAYFKPPTSGLWVLLLIALSVTALVTLAYVFVIFSYHVLRTLSASIEPLRVEAKSRALGNLKLFALLFLPFVAFTGRIGWNEKKDLLIPRYFSEKQLPHPVSFNEREFVRNSVENIDWEKVAKSEWLYVPKNGQITYKWIWNLNMFVPQADSGQSHDFAANKVLFVSGPAFRKQVLVKNEASHPFMIDASYTTDNDSINHEVYYIYDRSDLRDQVSDRILPNDSVCAYNEFYCRPLACQKLEPHWTVCLFREIFLDTD